MRSVARVIRIDRYLPNRRFDVKTLSILCVSLGLSAVAGVRGGEPTPPPDVSNVRITSPCPDPISGNPEAKIDLGAVCEDPKEAPSRPRVTVRSEFLVWWMKSNRVNASLLNTTLQRTDLGADIRAGGMSDRNAFPLFANRPLSPGEMLGTRLTVDVSFDETNSSGIEVVGTWLPRSVESNVYASGPNGRQSLILPYREVFPTDGTETGGVVAGLLNGRSLEGAVSFTTATQFWGGEVNYRACLSDGIEGLVGFRYLGLSDSLTIASNTALASGGGSTLDFLSTRNHFYGGQVGLRFTEEYDRWTFGLSTKIAAGGTRQRSTITGSGVQPTILGGGSVPVGFYALSTNSGTTSNTRFGYVPEASLRVGYALTDHLTFSVGYDFLYWDDVMRTGNQLDRNINSLNSPFVRAANGGTPVGPMSPSRLDSHNDFWVQGVTLGLALNF